MSDVCEKSQLGFAPSSAAAPSAGSATRSACAGEVSAPLLTTVRPTTTTIAATSAAPTPTQRTGAAGDVSSRVHPEGYRRRRTCRPLESEGRSGRVQRRLRRSGRRRGGSRRLHRAVGVERWRRRSTGRLDRGRFPCGLVGSVVTPLDRIRAWCDITGGRAGQLCRAPPSGERGGNMRHRLTATVSAVATFVLVAVACAAPTTPPAHRTSCRSR